MTPFPCVLATLATFGMLPAPIGGYLRPASMSIGLAVYFAVSADCSRGITQAISTPGEGRRAVTLADVSRIFTVSVASVYPHYVTKVEKKGRTKAELDQVIGWLTGFDEAELRSHLDAGTTFEDFFADARLNPNAP